MAAPPLQWFHIPTYAGSYITESEFDELWNLKPKNKLVLRLGGRDVTCPRYSKNYLGSYNFNALAVEQGDSTTTSLPTLIQRVYKATQEIDSRVNQILVNWYEEDGYIGYHSDDTSQLINNSPIFSYSYTTGTRVFRLREKANHSNQYDIPLVNNICIVMLDDCQDYWEHSAIKTTVKDGCRRINITLRCLESSE